MMERKTVQKRMLLDLIAHPLTLILITASVTLLLVAWALVRQTGIFLFGALAALAGAAATALTRFFLFGERIAKKVGDEIQQERNHERDCALDSLEKTLAQDGDGRGAVMLSELRDLTAAMKEAHSRNTEMSPLSLELTLDSEQLFTRCVAALEQSHQIWQSSRSVSSENARRSLMKQHRSILEEVRKSVEQFARALDTAQTWSSSEPACQELGQVRAQLEQSLAAAERLQGTSALPGDAASGSAARKEAVHTRTH